MTLLRWLSSRIFWGIVLILGGIALLLENLGVFSAGDYFWGGVFTLAGIAFFLVYAENRLAWWAFIPGFTLMGIGISSLVNGFLPQFGDRIGGTIFFIFIAMGFIAVYIVERLNWWAIIPAGVLTTLGVVTLVDNTNLSFDSGIIFFVGMGLTFAILGILPGYESMLRWAFIPAGALLVIGLMISASSSSMVNLIIPAIIVLIGVILVLRTLVRSKP